MLQIPPQKTPLGRVFMKFVCFGIELNRKNKKITRNTFSKSLLSKSKKSNASKVTPMATYFDDHRQM